MNPVVGGSAVGHGLLIGALEQIMVTGAAEGHHQRGFAALRLQLGGQGLEHAGVVGDGQVHGGRRDALQAGGLHQEVAGGVEGGLALGIGRHGNLCVQRGHGNGPVISRLIVAGGGLLHRQDMGGRIGGVGLVSGAQVQLYIGFAAVDGMEGHFAALHLQAQHVDNLEHALAGVGNGGGIAAVHRPQGRYGAVDGGSHGGELGLVLLLRVGGGHGSLYGGGGGGGEERQVGGHRRQSLIHRVDLTGLFPQNHAGMGGLGDVFVRVGGGDGDGDGVSTGEGVGIGMGRHVPLTLGDHRPVLLGGGEGVCAVRREVGVGQHTLGGVGGLPGLVILIREGVGDVLKAGGVEVGPLGVLAHLQGEAEGFHDGRLRRLLRGGLLDGGGQREGDGNRHAGGHAIEVERAVQIDRHVGELGVAGGVGLGIRFAVEHDAGVGGALHGDGGVGLAIRHIHLLDAPRLLAAGGALSLAVLGGQGRSGGAVIGAVGQGGAVVGLGKGPDRPQRRLQHPAQRLARAGVGGAAVQRGLIVGAEGVVIGLEGLHRCLVCRSVVISIGGHGLNLRRYLIHCLGVCRHEGDAAQGHHQRQQQRYHSVCCFAHIVSFQDCARQSYCVWGRRPPLPVSRFPGSGSPRRDAFSCPQAQWRNAPPLPLTVTGSLRPFT